MMEEQSIASSSRMPPRLQPNSTAALNHWRSGAELNPLRKPHPNYSLLSTSVRLRAEIEMSVTSFLLSFVPVAYADAPDKSEKGGDKEEEEKEEKEEKEDDKEEGKEEEDGGEEDKEDGGEDDDKEGGEEEEEEEEPEDVRSLPNIDTPRRLF